MRLGLLVAAVTSKTDEFGEADVASSAAGETDMADVIGAGGPFRLAGSACTAGLFAAAGVLVEADGAREDGAAGMVVSNWGVRSRFSASVSAVAILSALNAGNGANAASAKAANKNKRLKITRLCVGRLKFVAIVSE